MPSPRPSPKGERGLIDGGVCVLDADEFSGYDDAMVIDEARHAGD